MGKNARDVGTRIPRRRVLKEPKVEAPAKNSLFREGLAIIFCFFGVFIFLALFSYYSKFDQKQNLGLPVNTGDMENMMGVIGFKIAHFLIDQLGYCSFSIVLSIFLVAGLILRQPSEEKILTIPRILLIVFFCLSLILASASMASILFGYNGGGFFGTTLAVILDNHVNEAGTILISLAAIVISLAVLVNLRLEYYFTGLKLIWAGTKTAAKDTGIVLNAGVKVGNNALRKTSGLLKGKSADHSNQDFVMGNMSSDNFILGEGIDESEEPEEEFVVDTRKRREKVARKAKRVLKARPNQIEEEDEEDDCDDDVEFDEDLELEEEEEINYIPLISREQKRFEKKAKKADVKSNVKSNLKSKQPDYAEYQLPSRDLLVGLDGVSADGPNDDELLQNSRKLEIALRNFKLGGRVVEVHPGPIVTLYQFEPAAGIKVQRIINLADDLALALKVESVRVYAPVPGKGTIGIEVPNADREVVRLRDIVDSDDFLNKPFSLALALGKDTYGHAYVADLAKMPHLLIAGATGTGKSVCINSLIMSLLYKNSPSDLRLILIDPKMLELSIYESIAHLLSPVVTNPKRARGVLYWAVEEMERRYEMMKEFGVRDMAMFNRMLGENGGKAPPVKKRDKGEVINLEEKDVLTTTAAQAMIDRNYAAEGVPNEIKGLEPLPRIVIIVDELADLMLTVGREIEELLTRLAQKARAAGIHLILATQRPSVNVITGLIKANFPARISFKVASKIDARTVMDASGAERLLGQGDMLFLSPSIGRVKRLHSPFVSDQEVHDVVSWIRDQGEPDYDVRIEKTLKALEDQEQKTANGEADTDISEYDPLYDQAVNIVLEKGQASTSMVQRVFRIGYNRAARILETMEKEGVVGPADGAKPRQVLLDSLEHG